jgi:hypothetical protein
VTVDDESRASAPLVRCKDTVSIQVSTTLSREFYFFIFFS